MKGGYRNCKPLIYSRINVIHHHLKTETLIELYKRSYSYILNEQKHD